MSGFVTHARIVIIRLIRFPAILINLKMTFLLHDNHANRNMFKEICEENKLYTFYIFRFNFKDTTILIRKIGSYILNVKSFFIFTNKTRINSAPSN